MATVFVHVGQCGNQVGAQFWEEAAKERVVAHPLFRREDGAARAVFADTEPKVVRRLLGDLGAKGVVTEAQTVCSSSGR